MNAFTMLDGPMTNADARDGSRTLKVSESSSSAFELLVADSTDVRALTSAILSVPTDELESSRLAYLIANAIPESAINSLVASRQELAIKSLRSALSISEAKKLALLEWRLGQHLDAQLGSRVDVIEKMGVKLRTMAADLHRRASEFPAARRR